MTHDDEPCVHLHGVTYDQYVNISDALGDTAGVRLAYLEGTLEIVTPSPAHEVTKTVLARLLEVFCLARGIALYGAGSTTLRHARKKRGLEPDECYSVGRAKDVPDIAIEVVVGRRRLDKLAIYEALGVREVWQFKRGVFVVRELRRRGGYVVRKGTALVEGLELDVLAEHAGMADQDAAVRAYFGAEETPRARQHRPNRVLAHEDRVG